MNTIANIELKHKRVFLRADLNVPLQNKTIVQDYRLQSIIPTIQYIQKKEGKVILATHIGRPQAHTQTNFFDENLSTKQLIPWFKAHNFKITFEPDLIKAQLLSQSHSDNILLLENMRFFNGEKGTPEERERFATLLKDLADVYVNDAFALSHRNDCSVTNLPQKFDEQNRAYGLLFQKEIKQLSKLKKDVKQPFVLIIGGNKLESKIPMIKHFLTSTCTPSSILIGGHIANQITTVKEILQQAHMQGIEIVLPKDHVIINDISGDIGPQTVKTFCKKIKTAQTIFINGTLGHYELPQFQHGTKNVLACIAQNTKAYKVAGGGDCVTAINRFNMQQSFDFLSTGGGATLHFLSKNGTF
jgi:3-phosphoglycerate kinase